MAAISSHCTWKYLGWWIEFNFCNGVGLCRWWWSITLDRRGVPTRTFKCRYTLFAARSFDGVIHSHDGDNTSLFVHSSESVIHINQLSIRYMFIWYARVWYLLFNKKKQVNVATANLWNNLSYRWKDLFALQLLPILIMSNKKEILADISLRKQRQVHLFFWRLCHQLFHLAQASDTSDTINFLLFVFIVIKLILSRFNINKQLLISMSE